MSSGRGRGIVRRNGQFSPIPLLSSLSQTHREESSSQNQASPNQTTTSVSSRAGVGRESMRSNARLPLETQQSDTIAKQIYVYVNHFKLLNFQYPLQAIYQYRVDITNNYDMEISFTKKRAIHACWIKSLPRSMQNNLAFDNDNLIISFKKLPDIDGNGVTYKISVPNHYGRQESFNLTIKLIKSNQGQIDLRQLDISSLKQILTTVLHEAASKNAHAIRNRSFYMIPTKENAFDLGDGKAGWRGFYSALVLSASEYKLALNLDVSYTVFMKEQPFLKFLYELISKHSIEDTEELEKQICMLQNTLSTDQRSIDYISEQIRGIRFI
ncbi:unnamed protein product [Didymodactylos carnosus]|uniref:Argonaute linker 1 domain-containing protein n=1 Tax=Didymodactylos carnosus TaxID=1234261 RepID=A0A815G3P4_9BILA|nr:unnamed protein product [Didymodactylos carnosus]CAF1333936.1 unnamed protein product [Didymodactylos carnosus]CAF4102572.1 unnamed protein product [Didymodactylos carnosus]CAF4189955.1 unnamed protein product [Didymodactylos carnosus]